MVALARRSGNWSAAPVGVETEFRRAAGAEEVFGLWDEGDEAFGGDLGGRVIFASVLVTIVGNGG